MGRVDEVVICSPVLPVTVGSDPIPLGNYLDLATARVTPHGP
jgi:hypothetical protein